MVRINRVTSKRALKPRRATPSAAAERRSAGIVCGPGTGKFVFRVRQSHVAAHYAPLIAKKAPGAVKLDLVLRMIGLSPMHSKAREAGFVLWDWSYADLYDLATTPPERRLRKDGERTEDRTPSELRHLKRKWVIRQLNHLRALGLVATKERAGNRPEIYVLSDDGHGKSFDDPDGRTRADWYVTVQGSLIASRTMAGWGSPQIAAYFASLFAEFYNPKSKGPRPTAGTARWWRSLAWFNNPKYEPRERTLLPFSTSLLEDGFAALEDEGFISVSKIKNDPVTNRRLDFERNQYWNRFTLLDNAAEKVTRAERPERPSA